MEHPGIFGNGGVLTLLFFNQVGIVNDGSQRRFDVMGYIGDQFRFHTLALQPLFHRCSHTFANAVQILAVALKIPEHSLSVNLRCKITGGQRFSAFLEFAEHQRCIKNQRDKHKMFYKPECHQNIQFAVRT